MIRSKQFIMVYKNVLLATSLSLGLLGCSDKKEEENKVAKVEQSREKNIKVSTQNKSAGKIEVSQSEDTFKVKVEEKEKTEDKSYYYSYSDKERKNSFTKEGKTYTSVDANIRVRTPYEKVRISMLVNSLSKDFIIKCSACHNDYANGIIGPSLLHKNEKEIFETISQYKKDEKKNVLMRDLVKNMSKKEIQDIASEIAIFNEKIRALK